MMLGDEDDVGDASGLEGAHPLLGIGLGWD